jgi:hypothetical protein
MMGKSGLLTAMLTLVVGLAAAMLGNSYQLFVLANVALTACVGVGLNVLLGLAGPTPWVMPPSMRSVPTPRRSWQPAAVGTCSRA